MFKTWQCVVFIYKSVLVTANLVALKRHQLQKAEEIERQMIQSRELAKDRLTHSLAKLDNLSTLQFRKMRGGGTNQELRAQRTKVCGMRLICTCFSDSCTKFEGFPYRTPKCPIVC